MFHVEHPQSTIAPQASTEPAQLFHVEHSFPAKLLALSDLPPMFHVEHYSFATLQAPLLHTIHREHSEYTAPPSISPVTLC